MARDADGGGSGVRLFAPFRIDVRDERLWRGPEELKIRRKPFAILKYLTANPRTLVTQQELVEAVWGKTAMSGSFLRTHMSELRRLLGDGVIETVVGRGYRLLLDVTIERPTTTFQAHHVEAGPDTDHVIGRVREMAVLQKAFTTLLDRKRQMVFIMGDPGIGRTFLVDAFVARVAAPAGAAIVSGACVEQSGGGEAYLPVLNALGAACRGPDGKAIIELLARHAPTWLAQMPGLVPDEKLQDLQLRLQATQPARMQRELAEALDVLAADRPVVLVLDDAHWANRPTVDLVAALAARRDPARIMVIVTCRAVELVKGEGLAKIIAVLNAHKQATSLHLDPWSAEALAAYLDQRFADHVFPPELTRTVHGMTGGNPLFCIAMIDDLQDGKLIRQADGRWRLTATIAEVASRRPDVIRQLIDIQIDRLKPTEQRIVEAASLVGLQFATDTVAHALELAPEQVEAACETLANDRRLFRSVTDETVQGAILPRYEFVHALYRDAALARISSAIKRLWQRKMTERGR